MNKKLIVWITAAVAAVAVMAVTVSVKLAQKPDFVPPGFDPSATVGFPSVDEEYAFASVNVNENEFYVCSKILVNDGKAKLFFTDAENNSVWAKIRIIDENGLTIGESGLIDPGEYIEEISLDDIPEKGTKIKLKVMLYEPQTYQSEGTVLLEAETV